MSECSPLLEFLKKFRHCRNASSSEPLIKYDFLPSRLCAVWYYRSSGSVSTMNALGEIYPHLNRALAIFIPNIIEVQICFTEKKKTTDFHFLPPCSIWHKNKMRSCGTDGYSRFPFFQFRKSFS